MTSITKKEYYTLMAQLPNPFKCAQESKWQWIAILPDEQPPLVWLTESPTYKPIRTIYCKLCYGRMNDCDFYYWQPEVTILP